MIRAARPSTPFLWLFIALLLGGKALVPSGWMPVVKDGGVRIALCTGAGPVMATLDADGTVHKDGSGHDAPREQCPFATLVLPFDVPSIAALAAPLAPAALPVAPLRETRFFPSARGLRPPAIGPPILA